MLRCLKAEKVCNDGRCEIAHDDKEGDCGAHHESHHADLHAQLARWTESLVGWRIHEVFNHNMVSKIVKFVTLFQQAIQSNLYSHDVHNQAHNNNL